jgi:penicillin-binding protein 1A
MLKKWWKKRWFRWPIIAIMTMAVLFFGLYASIYFGVWGHVPDKNELANLEQSEATQILDHNGKLIGKYFTFDREPVKFDDLPKNLINALVATEDARFYEHDGVDNRSLLRVFFKTILMSDKSSGGGSTITLQLAKNLFGRDDFGFMSIVVNKLRESIVAGRLEEIYSKQEILTMYFNTVPFSDNTYGIQSAAHKFFSKDVWDLKLRESAVLVGSLKANHSYNPRLFPERSQLRRDVVLHQMEKYNYISQAQMKKNSGQPIELDYHYYSQSQGTAPYFRQYVKVQLENLLDEKKYHKEDGSKFNLTTDGLRVYTTLDKKLQEYAETAMKRRMQKLQAAFENAYGNQGPWENEELIHKKASQLPEYKRLKNKGLSKEQILDTLSVKKEMEWFSWEGSELGSHSTLDSLQHYLKILNTGMLSLDPKNGAIRTYIGGIDYSFFQYDHVRQSKRQVGSTFKPFVYTAALENGMDPCRYFPVEEVTYTDEDNWTPKNADGKNDKDMNYSLEGALSKSLNTIAVKVLYETGIDKTITQAHKMGIESEIKEMPSIALGTQELGVMEMAKAYTTFVNDRRPVKPFAITKIEDRSGKVIADLTKTNSSEERQKPAFSKKTQQVMLEFMQETVNSGTARSLRSVYGLRNDLAGKTGTTQDNKDGWFVGISPKLVNVVWVGNDHHEIGFKSTRLGQGAHSALPIFARFWQSVNKDDDFDELTRARFPKPSAEVRKALDCEMKKRDGFFKRLFKGGKKEKDFEKEEKDDGGWLW